MGLQVSPAGGSATAVAGAIWDEAVASHTTGGSFGAEFGATSPLVDKIWDELLSGHTTMESFAWNAVRHTVKSLAFTGAANLGEIGNVPLFTVTGTVLIVLILPFCTEDLVGASTLALGVTGNTSLFIAATTGTDIDNGDYWVDTAPDAAGVAVPAALKDIIIDSNIVGTVASANITDGTIRHDVYWLPLSSDGAVAAA